MNFKGVKTGFISAGLLCLCTLASKEAFSQKFIIGYGLSVYTDLVFLSPQPSADDGVEYENIFGASFGSISAEMKYNLHEFNSDLAFSVASSPSFGLMSFSGQTISADMGFGNLRLPVYAQLDYGNLSTFQSMKNFGVGVGLGYEYDMYAIFGGTGGALNLGTFAARLGVRYFNNNNAAREIALKFALPKTIEGQEYETFDYNTGNTVYTEIDQKVTGIQLSWILYFNY